MREMEAGGVERTTTRDDEGRRGGENDEGRRSVERTTRDDEGRRGTTRDDGVERIYAGRVPVPEQTGG